ncbi:MAG: glucan biosynthesis protein [Rhodomicrobium sp.]|nr:glucan biosynthesis protein [Rhodomicrobium sp.]
MDRRDALKLGAGFSLAALLARHAASASGAIAAEVPAALPFGDSVPFSEDAVIEQARLLAKSPYSRPQDTVPQRYKDLDYDQYRAIRFKKDLALWKRDDPGFTAEFFSAGYIYPIPVQIFVVDGGKSAELKYDRQLFPLEGDWARLRDVGTRSCDQYRPSAG